jgi:chaperonin cofactor prefoldin
MTSLWTPREMEEEFGQVFAPEQTARLVKAMDAVWQTDRQRAADTHELKQGLAALSGEVRRLAAAQRRTDERLAALASAQARTEQRLEELASAQARTEQRLEELASAQARTEQRLERLEAAVERLATAQARTEERLERLEATVERLAEAQVRTEGRLQELTDTVADLKGWQLESRYRERAGAYFGPLLRPLRVILPHELEDQLELHLPAADLRDLLLVDLLLRGQPRERPEAPPVWLAVEVSAVVDRRDVERAQRRADLLRQAGCRAIPTVAGEHLTAGAEEAARTGHILVIQDGRSLFWEEALAAALAD